MTADTNVLGHQEDMKPLSIPREQVKNNIKKTNMKKIRPTKRTLIEFKNWLQGLQEFQEEDWIPNLQQWELIKASINVIKEAPAVAQNINNIVSKNTEPVESSLNNIQYPAAITPVQPARPIIDMRNQSTLNTETPAAPTIGNDSEFN